MKVTCIFKNLTDVFFFGNGQSIQGFMNKTDEEKFAFIKSSHAKDLSITYKIESGQFRDAVELNSLTRNPCSFAFNLEPRKGYKLGTFEINKL